MAAETPALQINLLGDFHLIVQGETVTELRSRSKQLLTYLILHRQAPQPRRRIAGQLWPNNSDAHARTNLRKELHYLRQGLPVIEQVITITNQSLYWQPQIPCQVDVVCFEAALATAGDAAGDAAIRALETALKVYRADLWLDCDEDWLDAEQERLRQQHVQALAQLTRLLQTQGDMVKAISMGHQWLQASLLEEGAYQSLMALYGATGDRATALQLYHQCMTTLQTELGVNPSPTTVSIYQDLLLAEEPAPKQPAKAFARSPASPTVHPPDEASRASLSVITPLPLDASGLAHTLVGRDQLLPTLEQWLLSSFGTPAPLLLLTGEPGIGKTSLLKVLAEVAEHHHWPVCWGSAFAAEQLRSYGVWIDLLRTAPFAACLPALEDASSPLSDRGQFLDAMVQSLTQAIGPEQPLLLLFDDIHWLDDASTTLLHYVFRLLGQGPLRVACAARATELQVNAPVLTLVKALRRAERLQEVTVPPLAPDAIAALVEPLLAQNLTEDSAQPLDRHQIYIDSGGNPLYALEAARAKTQASSNLSGLIDDRLQRLDGSARDLLPWAAALGRRFNPETLALAASYPPMQFLTAIEQLEAQQIVCPAQANHPEAAGNYDFIHDLVRQVAYDRLSQPRRRIIHGQLAQTLESQMVDDDLASQVAYHAGLASSHALAAQASAAAAARSLRLFAYEDVLQLVAQGLHHCQCVPSRDRLLLAARLLRIRVYAGVASADVATVEGQLHQLQADSVGLAVPEAAILIQDALTLLNYEHDNLTAVHEQALKAIESLPPSPHLQAESLAANGCCLAEIERDMVQAEAILLEAQSLAERLGLVFIDIAAGLGCVERHRGDYGKARTYLQQAIQQAQNQQDFVRQGYALIHLVMVGWDSQQPEVAATQALLDLSTQLPAGSEGAFAQALMALSNYREDASVIEPVNQGLRQLDQLDAQRKIAFVASYACELARQHCQPAIAQHYATLSYRAAKLVGHPNDLASALALGILTTPDEEAQQAYWQALAKLLADSHPLSARSQALRNQAQQFMQQLMSNPN
ncbi:MAG: BTAD domain-containing putative transcriptional regulator [Cyanobacteria bacterium P01_F01_bin.86]